LVKNACRTRGPCPVHSSLHASGGGGGGNKKGGKRSSCKKKYAQSASAERGKEKKGASKGDRKKKEPFPRMVRKGWKRKKKARNSCQRGGLEAGSNREKLEAKRQESTEKKKTDEVIKKGASKTYQNTKKFDGKGPPRESVSREGKGLVTEKKLKGATRDFTSPLKSRGQNWGGTPTRKGRTCPKKGRKTTRSNSRCSSKKRKKFGPSSQEKNVLPKPGAPKRVLQKKSGWKKIRESKGRQAGGKNLPGKKVQRKYEGALLRRMKNRKGAELGFAQKTRWLGQI